MDNTIVAGNLLANFPNNDHADFNGTYTNLGGNLASTSDSSVSEIDPELAPLGNYGGALETMIPLPGSPAICGGLPANAGETDERGFPGTTAYGADRCADSGAVQTHYSSVAFSRASYSGTAGSAINPAPVVTVTENGQKREGIPVTLLFSGTGTATGLGPVTTAVAGALFSDLQVSAAGTDTLTAKLPITAKGNKVQPAPLKATATLAVTAAP
jgi:hypothetical protein